MTAPYPYPYVAVVTERDQVLEVVVVAA